MSLLGIDAGTTGCKVVAFAEDGRMLASAYREYDVQSPRPGWAELDAPAIWDLIEAAIGEVAAATKAAGDPPRALCVSSMGEAVVPVSADRRVLGPSILNFDVRGEEFLPALAEAFVPETLYELTGNTLGNHFGLTKMLWLKRHQPELYGAAAHLLPWSAFIAFMLGAEPAVDYSLGNRLLCFDLDRGAWAAPILEATGLDPAKLGRPVPTGTVVGTVAAAVAARLGLPAGVRIIAGGHDQCLNSIGCGVLEAGQAMIGMGTYLCITPVFSQRPAAAAMIARGFNTEHHAVAGRYVSFLYNQGGALLKWYRNTFAQIESAAASAVHDGDGLYSRLLDEMPEGPSSVLALPHFIATGPPAFVSETSGVLAGLHLGTTRGEVLKGLLQGVMFYLRECVDSLEGTPITIRDLRAAGGGSRSDRWLQLTADIMGVPVARTACPEAGALGGAILAGVGVGQFASPAEGVAAMVRPGRPFEPDPARRRALEPAYRHYRKLWPTMRQFLAEWERLQKPPEIPND